MAAQAQLDPTDRRNIGFAVIDDKGRISLPKPVRSELGIGPGSVVAYVALDDVVMLIPQDRELLEVMDRAAGALERAGLTVQDVVDAAMQARVEIFIESYPPEFVEQLRRMYREIHAHGTEDE